MAVTLAKGEGLTGETLLAVEMAALLHDVQDWKYAATKDFDVKVLAFQQISPEKLLITKHMY